MRIVITRRGTLDVPDGINIFIFTLAAEFLRRGIETFAMSNIPYDRERVNEYYGRNPLPELVSFQHNIRTGHFSRVRAEVTGWSFAGRRIHTELKPDLTIINGALPIPLRGTTITVAHDSEVRGHRSIQSIYKAISYRVPNHLVATTPEIQRNISELLRISSDTISVIPTCVDLTQYLNLPFDQRQNAVLHIGTALYKNPSATIRTFSQLPTCDSTLLITGPISPALLQQVSSAPPQIRERIHLLGFVSSDQLRTLLGTVRLVSCPSIYDSPVASPTVLEAYASGTPVALSSSITSSLIDLEAPQTFADSSLATTASEMNRILTDQPYWEQRSRNADNLVAPFSVTEVADRYLELAELA